MPVTMDDIFDAYNQVQSQGLQPDTIIMHPDFWEQISRPVQPVTFKVADIRPWQPVAIGPDGWPVIPPEPPVYKCRWQSIMEDEL